MSLEICGPRVWHFHTSPAPKIFIVCKIFQSEKTLGCYFKFSSKAPLHQRQKPSLQHGYLSCIAACLLKTRHGRERGKTQILAFTMFSRNQIWLFSCRLSGSQNSRTSNENLLILVIAPSPLRIVWLVISTSWHIKANVAISDVSQHSAHSPSQNQIMKNEIKYSVQIQQHARVRVEVVFEWMS